MSYLYLLHIHCQVLTPIPVFKPLWEKKKAYVCKLAPAVTATVVYWE